MDIEQLNERSSNSGVAVFEEGPGGLKRLNLTCDGHQAQVFLHGAHVAHFCPAGAESVLWMSRRSWFAADKPIRGGVPVCFPWFGPKDDDPEAAVHGFARLREFTVESVTHESGAPAVATLLLKADDRTRSIWPGEFELRHTISLAATLTMALEVRNVGDEAFTVPNALHSYFRVGDVRNVSVSGLADTAYVDKVAGGQTLRQGPEPITFAGETDRVYLDTSADCVIDDSGMGRKITIAKSGSASTVVWNPWTAKAARMPDYDDNEWPGMLCVETANAFHNAVTVDPGQSHTLEARISVG